MTSNGAKPKTLSTQPACENETEEIASLVQDLSPTSKSNAVLLLQSLRKKEAVLGEDDKGRPVIQYKDEKSSRVWWDASAANVISQTKSDTDVQSKMDACLELIDFLKKNKPPSGVVFDHTHVNPRGGFYRESKEFTKTNAVLGTGYSAGDIIVVKDKKTGTESAQKTMMISVFRKEEIRAWVDLNETGIPPALYCFKLEGNRVHIFMEKIDQGVTLRDVIDKHMSDIRAADPALVKPFSLYVFHGLLSAVHTMHQKGWTHKDLHPGNIMLQASPEGIIKTRILDFGLAKPFFSEDGLRGFRSDMIEVVRKFTALYVDQEFNSETDAKKNWRERLHEMADIFSLSPEDKADLFCLIDSALQIASLSEVSKLQQEIESKMDFDPESLSKKIAKILFAKPDKTAIESLGKTQLFGADQDMKTDNHPDVTDMESELQKIKLIMGSNIQQVKGSTMDCADSHDSRDMVLETDDYVTDIDDTFLENLRRHTSVGW